jgi:hypothetical protein
MNIADIEDEYDNDNEDLIIEEEDEVGIDLNDNKEGDNDEEVAVEVVEEEVVVGIEDQEMRKNDNSMSSTMLLTYQLQIQHSQATMNNEIKLY